MADLGDDCWSSEEEELNFGGTMGVQGVAAIRSATFVENNNMNYGQAAASNALQQPVSYLLKVHQLKGSANQFSMFRVWISKVMQRQMMETSTTSCTQERTTMQDIHCLQIRAVDRNLCSSQ